MPAPVVLMQVKRFSFPIYIYIYIYAYIDLVDERLRVVSIGDVTRLRNKKSTEEEAFRRVLFVRFVVVVVVVVVAVIFHSLASHLVCAIVVLDEQLSQFHSAPRTATRTSRANLVQVN